MEPNFELQDEYKYKNYVSMSDAEITEDRLHPKEVTENAEVMQQRLEKINNEYKVQNKNKNL